MEQFGAYSDFDGTNYIINAGTAYIAGTYQIEPDMSAACYFYAAAALMGGSAIVKAVTWECMQGDLKFIKLLEQMGCLTTFVMVAALYVLGVTSIKEFALPLMVGIVCGTYSSVCITGALWYVLRTKIKKA